MTAFRRKRAEMAISEAELVAMTHEMNELHQQTFPQMKAGLAELAASRRGMFKGVGAIGGVVLLTAACGSDAEDDATGNPTATTGTGSGSADNKVLATNASLENLAVFAYGAALKAAPMGKFGPVPPAVAAFAAHAMKQHQDHADAFNAALTNAGGKAFTAPDPALAPAVTKMFGELKDVPGLAKLALTLENTAGATYTKQMGEVSSAAALSAIATIAPVERQHAAILSFVLGEYPIPDTFVKLDATPTSLGARPSSDAG